MQLMQAKFHAPNGTFTSTPEKDVTTIEFAHAKELYEFLAKVKDDLGEKSKTSTKTKTPILGDIKQVGKTIKYNSKDGGESQEMYNAKKVLKKFFFRNILKGNSDINNLNFNYYTSVIKVEQKSPYFKISIIHEKVTSGYLEQYQTIVNDFEKQRQTNNALKKLEEKQTTVEMIKTVQQLQVNPQKNECPTDDQRRVTTFLENYFGNFLEKFQKDDSDPNLIHYYLTLDKEYIFLNELINTKISGLKDDINIEKKQGDYVKQFSVKISDFSKLLEQKSLDQNFNATIAAKIVNVITNFAINAVKPDSDKREYTLDKMKTMSETFDYLLTQDYWCLSVMGEKNLNAIDTAKTQLEQKVQEIQLQTHYPSLTPYLNGQ